MKLRRVPRFVPSLSAPRAIREREGLHSLYHTARGPLFCVSVLCLCVAGAVLCLWLGVSMCLCVCVSVYLCVYVYLCMYVSVYLCLPVSVCTIFWRAASPCRKCFALLPKPTNLAYLECEDRFALLRFDCRNEGEQGTLEGIVICGHLWFDIFTTSITACVAACIAAFDHLCALRTSGRSRRINVGEGLSNLSCKAICQEVSHPTSYCFPESL